MQTIRFADLRPDWFANGSLVARAIQRQLRCSATAIEFVGFPRHFLPLFAWAGAAWRDSIEPATYVPLISARSQADVERDIEAAKNAGALRLLLETVGSAEIVLCETLQRIDAAHATPDPNDIIPVTLTNWHGYSRPECRAFDEALAGFRQTKPDILFIPCAKTRPYPSSQAHRRLIAAAAGIDPAHRDVVVITSIGPVPESLWHDPFVLRYDTGVRDIYRLLIQLRPLLAGTDYRRAWDLIPFTPYSDLLTIVHREGLLPSPQRLPSIRRRNIPTYRPSRRR